MSEFVTVEIAGGIASVRLNRPQALNALSREMFEGLELAVARIAADETVRAVVLTGEGRAFCAGGDLKFFRRMVEAAGNTEFVAFQRYSQGVLDALEQLPVPVIAAVNGDAVAGGLELILCCDVVIAAQSARIGDGHVNFGVIPGGGSTARLERKIPASHARYLLFSGALLPAAELKAMGLVSKVVPDAQLREEALAMAAQMARHSRRGLVAIKQLLLKNHEEGDSASLAREALAFIEYTGTPDFREGLKAFADRKKAAPATDAAD